MKERDAGSVAVLVDACSHRLGGGITYLGNLLPLLAREPGIGPVVAVVEPAAALVEALAGTPVRLETRWLVPNGLAGRLLWEATALRRRARGTVVLSPNSILPRRLPVPVVAVPHNILPFLGRGPRNAIKRAAIQRTLSWATGVVFVSEEMRRQVRRFTDHPALERVIPHGVGEAFTLPMGAGTARDGIVVVGDRNPHKRLDLMVAAWRLLGRDRPRLRVIGASDHHVAGEERGISFENDLPPADVAAALRAAALAVLPSTAESFGLSALEALACGAPLLVSDIPAVREVTGGNAVYVDSGRAEVWADAMRTILAAPQTQDQGREWALRFTWKRSAAATAGLLLDAHHEASSIPTFRGSYKRSTRA
jgi:glycosyltransferase involved in cell wall biosynthesis